MRKFIISFVLVVFSCTWASAASSVWKAQKGNVVIYLGGTCHVLRETDYPLPQEFDKAYKASDTVVFETDIDKLNDPATQQQMLAKAVYTDGSTIDKHLSPRVYGELRAYCTANGIPLQALSRFKPSILMVTLTLMEFMRLGVTRQGVDTYYYELARMDKKNVEVLETADEQIDYLVSMADGNEDEFVSYSIRDMETIMEKFESLAAAWRKGDVEKLAELMITEVKTRQPILYRKLITDRNRNWLPVIEAGTRTPHTRFILVGVGHLVGPDGILEALGKKGYRVDRL